MKTFPQPSSPMALRDRKRRKPPLWVPPGGGRGGIRRRGRRRVRRFVQREQIIAFVPAVGADSLLAGEMKLFLRIGPFTLIEHVVRRLLRCVGNVVVATPESEIGRTRAILGGAAEVCCFGAGYAQALSGLLEFAAAPYVVVHNVSWPFASPRLIREVILTAAETGAASAVDFPDGPIGRINIDHVAASDDQRRIAIAQSPGAFRRDILEHALQCASPAQLDGDSSWEMLYQAGARITPVENEECNIRIETSLDWEIARRAIWPHMRQRWQRRRNAGEQDSRLKG